MEIYTLQVQTVRSKGYIDKLKELVTVDNIDCVTVALAGSTSSSIDV